MDKNSKRKEMPAMASVRKTVSIIEAKKAAVRAEDIAKGVFVPVSSLPQKEPMKAVI